MAMTAAPRPDLFFADRYGLTQSRLDALVGSAASRVDYADVFIEYQVAEELVIEDGVVKKASRTISQGGGVRAQAGVRTGYAYTDDLDIRHLEVAARQAQAIAEHPGEAGPVAVHSSPRPHDSTISPSRPWKRTSARRWRCSARWTEWRGPRTLASARSSPRSPRSSDRADRDVRQLAAGGRAAPDPTERDGGRRGRRPARGRELRRRRARGVRLLHRGRALGPLREGGGAPGPRQAGRGRGAGGDDDGRAGTGMAGHPAPRGDRPRPRGRLQPEGRVRVHGRVGERVASDLVTVVDDGTIPNRRGSLNVDDEGTPTSRTVLIENGVLRGYMQDRLNARLLGTGLTGNGRRETFQHPPMPRMTNTFMLAGEDAPEDIVRSVPAGSTPSRSAAGRWTSPAASSSSRRARPT